MPAGEETPRQRASSPSEQSSSSWHWISTTTTTGGHQPGSVSTAAAARPTAIISHVTPLGVSCVGISSRVRYGDRRRMYSLPAQCSPLLRAKIESGCVRTRSSAIEGIALAVGRRERLHALERGGVVELEVLEDRVAVGTGQRRVHDGLRELRLAEPEVGGDAREVVPAQAGVQAGGEPVLLAQPGGEQARGAGELAVARGAGEEVVDRVQDLVVAAAARPRGAGRRHREAAEHERLGERDQERVVVDPVV